MDFWIGYAAALATYFLIGIGIGIGIYIVATNLARFHGGGFQVRRMIGSVMLIMIFWPGSILELIVERSR